MLGIKVKRENAEAVRRLLGRNGRLDTTHTILRRNTFIYIPLGGKPDKKTVKKLRELGAEKVNRIFTPQRKRTGYKELLKKLGKGQQDEMSRGYDLFGSIAVIDVSPGLAKKAAAALLKTNKNVRTVLRKGSAVTGRYRTRRFYYVAGKKNYTADYKENGCRFRFDVRDVFFSTRLAFERKRITDLVRNGENVVVMFAGVGPYAIEIAKARRGCAVVAIELNRKAHKHMIENIRLNSVANVVPVLGDVKKVAKRYNSFADRIIMPLPKDASEFLGEVLVVAKDRCKVHYYTFCDANRIEEVTEKTGAFFKERGWTFRPIGKRIVRPYSSSEIEIVLDFLITRRKP